VTRDDWRAFLDRWSGEWLDVLDDVELEQLPREAVERRTLGNEGATESQIASAEHRLGVALPPQVIAGSVDPKLRTQHRELGDRLLKEMRKRDGIEARFPDYANAAFDAEVAHARDAAR
jgi:hypothetical protein